MKYLLLVASNLLDHLTMLPFLPSNEIKCGDGIAQQQQTH